MHQTIQQLPEDLRTGPDPARVRRFELQDIATVMQCPVGMVRCGSSALVKQSTKLCSLCCEKPDTAANAKRGRVVSPWETLSARWITKRMNPRVAWVLAACGEDAELRSTWSRYQLARSVISRAYPAEA